MSAGIKYPIVVNNLCRSFYGREVLHDISLVIEKNKFYSIIGPNGSGKTTLLKNISKILEPEKETVLINGCDVASMKSRELARNISCVNQNTHIEFDFSVMDIVLMGRSPYCGRFQSESQEDMDIAKKAMMATNTWHLRNKNINEISGGERQRVIVARALAQDTGIMLLDEPISQLDIQHQIEILDTIRHLMKIKGSTVVAVLHDLNLAAQYSDCLILLNGGRIVSQGPPEQVISEENIQKVYNIRVYVMKNPFTGRPHVIPIKADTTSHLVS